MITQAERKELIALYAACTKAAARLGFCHDAERDNLVEAHTFKKASKAFQARLNELTEPTS